jgi:hypothetical protein
VASPSYFSAMPPFPAALDGGPTVRSSRTQAFVGVPKSEEELAAAGLLTSVGAALRRAPPAGNQARDRGSNRVSGCIHEQCRQEVSTVRKEGVM